MYVFDETGSSPSNLVVDEVRTLTQVNGATYRVIIPDYAPFYTTNLVVKFNDGVNGDVILQDGVDYVLVLPYIAATRSVGISVYGGISFNFNAPNGNIKVSYQTIGSPWIANIAYVYQALAESVYNERMTAWDTLTDVQQIFPPVNHDHMLDFVYDYADLINKIGEVTDAITQAAQGHINPAYGAIPNRIVVTSVNGASMASSVAIQDLATILATYNNTLTRLNNAESVINNLVTRVETLEQA